MSKDYEKLALKYKLKCMKLEKEISLLQRGGDGEEEKEESKQEFTIPNWYEQFSQQLTPIYNAVKDNYYDIVLTGSAAIALTLHNLGMIEELNQFQPGDADFLYNENPKNLSTRPDKLIRLNKDTINVEFSSSGSTKYILRPNQKQSTSVTYDIDEELKTSKDYFFKNFDVSATLFTKYSTINEIKVLNMEILKPYYEDVYNTSGDEEKKAKAKIKLDIIDKIIERQGNGQETELEETKLPGPGRGLFNDDSNYESDNEEKPSGRNLFGEDSDDESMNKKSFAKKEQFIKIKYE